MSKVRLVQLLCPKRHCIMGFAYETKDGAQDLTASAHLVMTFVEMIDKGMVNPSCLLCKSKDIKAEDRVTIFATMEEAKPYLRQMEREQAETRKFWEASEG